MKKVMLKTIERIYANAGQQAECVVRYTLTGEAGKADNKAFWTGGDVLDIQIKSAKASVCRGTDIRAHVAMDGANRYGYVNKDFDTMYLMSPEEWIEMVDTFATVTRESAKNGGAEKLRLKSESRAMVEWLEARVG